MFNCLLDQLKMIKKITLGHVICATTNVDHVQKDIFKTIDHKLEKTIHNITYVILLSSSFKLLNNFFFQFISNF